MERRLREKRKQKKRAKGTAILIFCEGEKTEPNYFKAFREYLKNPSVNIKIIGEGFNTLSLVKRAIEYQKKHTIYNIVWVVFDKDSFSNDSFNRAIDKARRKNIKVAYLA